MRKNRREVYNLNAKAKKSGAGALIFLAWLLYALSYLGKVNYSANITQIVDFYGITKAEAGLVPSFFFFAYGIGQVINGIFCKRYNIKWSVFTGLMISVTINCIIGITSNFAIVKWLWMINGFALSMLWPSLVRMLSENLPQKELANSTAIMTSTVATGTIIIYALSSFYALFNNFKLAFFTPAITGVIVSVIWLCLYDKMTTRSRSLRDAEEAVSGENVQQVRVATEENKKEKRAFLILLAVLCLCSVGTNLVKDGLTTWVPSILKEEYDFSDSLSILLTISLLIVAIFGGILSVKLHNKVSNYVANALVLFVVVIAVTIIIIVGISTKTIFLMLPGLIVASLFASALNNLVTALFPMLMRSRGNSGMFAGILNGFCYLGSALSSYGLGYIADITGGWLGVFWTLLGFMTLVCIVCIIYLVAKKKA